MLQRQEFVCLAQQAGINFRGLCRRFGISAKTGYKWMQRYRGEGPPGLRDRSRRPKRWPRQSPVEVTAAVIALRQAQPTWGGRKLRRRLLDLGHARVPQASTCTAILRRAGLLGQEPVTPAARQRFERARPNELWQMDFKGHFPTQAGPRCHPLTLLDDHSRFNLVLHAGPNQTAALVQQQLLVAFARYGLPEALLCDNGAPWGATESFGRYTALTIWLLRLGVRVLHGRPYHPQTQGKEERFHRTLHRDLLCRHTWRDLAHCAEHFVRFRHTYNCERPHDALHGDPPVRHYQPSPRGLPASLPALEYPAGTERRVVHRNGAFVFRNADWGLGRAFAELAIGLRPSPQPDGQWEVWFANQPLGCIDLRTAPPSPHALRPVSFL